MKSFRTSAVLGALAVVALSSGAAFAGTCLLYTSDAADE